MKNRVLQPDTIERVVVRGANWVGDAVMTVPALRELRRVLPGAHITLATRAWAEGIFAGADFVDDLLIVDREPGGALSFVHQAREWRAGHYDLAVLFPNAFKPALLAFAARVPYRTGYATEGRGPLLSHPLPVPTWRGQRHEVFYYLNIVAELERKLYGATAIESHAPRLGIEVSAERQSGARSLLQARGVRLDRTLVALCPGSTNSRAKRWPAERFAAVADLLCGETGAQVLLIGAREERAVSDEVTAKMNATPFVLTGDTRLDETAAVLSLCDLLVTNDTGPAHLAASVGCPVIVIFGPTDPVTTSPYTDAAQVVRQPPDCAPCMLRDCPIDHRCMTAITPEDVFARASRMLARRVPAAEVAR